MKTKLILIVLAFVMLISLPAAASPPPGDPNVDAGGGGMGGGTAADLWNPGMEGVRVSIVDAETLRVLGTPIDYTNRRPTPEFHFVRRNKIQYRNGAALTPNTGTYHFRNPSAPLPTIISSRTLGPSCIEAIRRYFGSEYVANMIARDFGISFERLTGGRYKLLLEPIAYFRFQGRQFAMTAHEAALFDQQLNGELRRRIPSLSHQNLPLAMFLERPDLGFQPFTGSRTGHQSNNTILTYLGIGTISYTEIEYPEPDEFDIEYRVNTEVITAVTLNAIGEINPDNPATVTFNVLGRT